MSHIEHELRVLDISTPDLVARIEKLGGTKEGEFFYRRYIFDTIPVTPGKWARLRTDGKSTTLAVKQISTEKVDGTEEWEIEVDNFETTLTILEKLGHTPRGLQESKRILYRLDSVELAIDTWPGIPSYLEIEGKDEKSIISCAISLGFEPEKLTAMNPEQIYLTYGINIQTEPNLTF